MQLTTDYMGIELTHPIMPGASPMVTDLDVVRRLEDSGASAIVMNSLFEEQIQHEESVVSRYIDTHTESFAEASGYLPAADDAFIFGPDEYVEQVRRIREIVDVPVIASLNGTTPGGWLQYARLIEEAGAHALELNLYQSPSTLEVRSSRIEEESEAIVKEVKESVTIPVAVKLSPFYTSLPYFARRLDLVGADALVLFNRFYQPDLDIEQLEVKPALELSSPSELRLRLRWVAMLSERLDASLAVSGGVHSAHGVIKAILSGAHAVQMVSALLRQGPELLRETLTDVERWFEEHEYESLEQARGSLNMKRCPDPTMMERENYFQVLRSHPS